MADIEKNTMKLSQEDIEHRKQYLRNQAQKRLDSKGKSDQSLSTSKDTPKNYLAMTSFCFAVLALGFAGYIYTQFQESNAKLARLNAQFADKSDQLVSLEEKLSKSGENSDLTVNELKTLLQRQENEIKGLLESTKNNTQAISSLPNVASLLSKQEGNVASTTDNKINQLEKKLLDQIDSSNVRIVQLESEIGLALQSEINKNSIESLKAEVEGLDKKVNAFGQSYDSRQIQNMKLEMEDIQIRLDRIQNALSSPSAL